MGDLERHNSTSPCLSIIHTNSARYKPKGVAQTPNANHRFCGRVRSVEFPSDDNLVSHPRSCVIKDGHNFTDLMALSKLQSRKVIEIYILMCIKLLPILVLQL